jgi:hypothetical protein
LLRQEPLDDCIIPHSVRGADCIDRCANEYFIEFYWIKNRNFLNGELFLQVEAYPGNFSFLVDFVDVLNQSSKPGFLRLEVGLANSVYVDCPLKKILRVDQKLELVLIGHHVVLEGVSESLDFLHVHILQSCHLFVLFYLG